MRIFKSRKMALLLILTLMASMAFQGFLPSYANGDDGRDGCGGRCWDGSSLQFIDQGGECELIWAEVKNGKWSGEMRGTSTYEVYWIESGNPKDGTMVGSGTIPALDNGDTFKMEYVPSGDNIDGVYKFKAYQRPGHPGIGVLWSGDITLRGCEIVPTGTLTVTKTFSDQNEDEVTVVLYGGDEPVSKLTEDHEVTFEGLDLDESYTIQEEPVPEGYDATYPDGTEVVFNDDHMASLGILNTPIPDGPTGTLTVTKTFSDQSMAEVTVILYNDAVVLDTTQTLNHIATFINLDLKGNYTIAEEPVSGYSVTYPLGQAVVFDEVYNAALSIVNTPNVTSGGETTTTTTTTRDRDRRRTTTTTEEETTTQEPTTVIVETAPPLAVPQVFTEEVVPLAVPVLPKTGELPISLFYGLGGVITAIGLYLKRK